jgi:hypothetical protein
MIQLLVIKWSFLTTYMINSIKLSRSTTRCILDSSFTTLGEPTNNKPSFTHIHQSTQCPANSTVVNVWDKERMMRPSAYCHAYCGSNGQTNLRRYRSELQKAVSLPRSHRSRHLLSQLHMTISVVTPRPIKSLVTGHFPS